MNEILRLFVLREYIFSEDKKIDSKFMVQNEQRVCAVLAAGKVSRVSHNNG